MMKNENDIYAITEKNIKSDDMTEQKIESELIYKGKILDLYKDKVLCPNGRKATREVIRHCAAVCILARVGDKFILEEQFRYPYDEIILEFPAGKVDEGEDYSTAALRELEEETGYKANRLVYLGEYYPACAYTDEKIYLYYADNLEKTQQHFDEDEVINCKLYTLSELEKMVRDGKIKDGKSHSILYLYQLNRDKIGSSGISVG